MLLSLNDNLKFIGYISLLLWVSILTVINGRLKSIGYILAEEYLRHIPTVVTKK